MGGIVSSAYHGGLLLSLSRSLSRNRRDIDTWGLEDPETRATMICIFNEAGESWFPIIVNYSELRTPYSAMRLLSTRRLLRQEPTIACAPWLILWGAAALILLAVAGESQQSSTKCPRKMRLACTEPVSIGTFVTFDIIGTGYCTLIWRMAI